MTTEDFISELFYRVDEAMKDIPKHPLANLWPSEIVTRGDPLCAQREWESRILSLAESRLAQLVSCTARADALVSAFGHHRTWTDEFLATPSVLGVVDSYGIELLHPMREGRSTQQIGRKGKSNHRWIVGGKLCLLLNQLGLVVAWDCAGANAPDTAFHPLIETFEDEMIVLE